MNEITTGPQPTEIANATSRQIAPATEATSLLNIIAMALENPNVDVAKLKELLAMQKEVLATQAQASFNYALARLTAAMPRVKKNGTINLGQGKGSIPFARWEDVDDVIRPLMRQEGFTLSFDTNPRQGDGGGAVVSGTLLHRDGHSKTVSIPLPLDNGPGRNNLQAMGSTLSYGKRYCAEMLLNIVREGVDDDGQAGSTEFITPQQANSLSAELDALDGDVERFLAQFGAATFQDIRRADLPRAMNLLAAKKRKIGEQRA